MSVLSEIYAINSVVGFYGDKAIVKQDDGTLFYAEVPQNLIMIGETINPRDLISLSHLPVEQQKEIKKQYADCEVV
ncbi:MAG: hypothetical protein J1E85_03290 [Ruminococcus sp.]|nr:hypothetical protein [Ruminococcus sp.]